MNNTYFCKHSIPAHEADAFGLWRADAAFRLMQEVAGAHSTQLGLSRDDMLKKHNCVWMIARAQLVVNRYPKLRDTLHVTTWYGEPGRITYPRYVSILDEAGAQLAAMATSWVVVEADTRRILLPAKAGLVFPPTHTQAPPLSEPDRQRLQKSGSSRALLRAPLYADIDVNGHMNNANYVSWLLDLFPLEWHAQHRLRSLYISYAAEARPDEAVRLTLYESENRFEAEGADQADGHIVFEAIGEWR